MKHRFHRVFLPVLLGMVTVVPATTWVSAVAMSSAASKPGGASPAGKASNIWAAARTGDTGAIERHLASGVAVNDVDPGRGGTPLLWAAVTGQAVAIELLISRSADLNAVDRDGGTALHAAAFLGHVNAVDVLVRNGASLNIANKRGTTPPDAAIVDEGTTRYFAFGPIRPWSATAG